jgi:hypothetical protein
MDSPQSRASLRVIKPSPKLNPRLQPKIKSAKAEKNDYSNFAAARVLTVTLVLLGLSLSHLAAGIALVTGAGPYDSWAMAIGIDLGFIALELARARRAGRKTGGGCPLCGAGHCHHIGYLGGDERICFRGHADGRGSG